jgi:hypothetical protein
MREDELEKDLGRQSHILETICPWCQHQLTRTSPTSKEDSVPPQEGDVSFCSNCGEWAMFTEGFSLRKPTEEELLDIGQDKEIRTIRMAWVMTRAEFLMKRLVDKGVSRNDLARAVDSRDGDLRSFRGKEHPEWVELWALLSGLRRSAER